MKRRQSDSTLYINGVILGTPTWKPLTGHAILTSGDTIEAIDKLHAFDSIIANNDGKIAVVDLNGRWILPGLVNMHEHLAMREVIGTPRDVLSLSTLDLTIIATRNAISALAQGWTTVRDMGARGGVALAVRDRIAAGTIDGPRVIAVGMPLRVTGGHGSISGNEADGPDGMRRAARAQLKAGADSIKVAASNDPVKMPGVEQTRPEMTFNEIKAAFEVAHAWGAFTSCHVMGTVAIANVIRAGADIIDHGIYLTEPLAEQLAENGVFYCPTLSGYMYQTMNPRFGRGAQWAANHQVLVGPHERALTAAINAGVKLLVGTDTTGVFRQELEIMRDAGVSSVEIIRACTENAAQAMGYEAVFGTIEVKKKADFVLLDGDPLEDITELARVRTVVSGGIAFECSELRARYEPGEIYALANDVGNI